MALKDRADIKKGERLLVLGAAGGVGIAAVELGKAFGAYVIAAASSQEKVDLARKCGADEGIVYPIGPFDRAGQKALADLFKWRLRAERASTLSTIRSAATTPRPRCARWRGTAASLSSASPPAFRRSR